LCFILEDGYLLVTFRAYNTSRAVG